MNDILLDKEVKQSDIHEAKKVFLKTEIGINIDDWLESRKPDIISRSDIYGVTRDHVSDVLFGIGRILNKQLDDFDFLDDRSLTDELQRKQIINFWTGRTIPGLTPIDRDKQLAKIKTVNSTEVLEMIDRNIKGTSNNEEQQFLKVLRFGNRQKYSPTDGEVISFSTGQGSVGINLIQKQEEFNQTFDHEITHYLLNQVGGNTIQAYLMRVGLAGLWKSSVGEKIFGIESRRIKFIEKISRLADFYHGLQEAAAFVYSGQSITEILVDEYEKNNIVSRINLVTLFNGMQYLMDNLNKDKTKFDNLLAHVFPKFASAILTLKEEQEFTDREFWKLVTEASLKI